jgi:hypothetical protein
MDEINKDDPFTGNEPDKKDCGCDGDCCKPKKTNIFTKLLFAVILLAALGIIGMKLVNKPDPKNNKEAVAAPAKGSCCDTTVSKCCEPKKDTTCCSKDK